MATQTDPLRPQGLIAKAASSQTPIAGYTAQTATAEKATSKGYDPSQVSVEKPTQTVQGQLQGILDTNSPLMQQAARRANQAMNARGLLNSSIGVGAAQDAVISSALPIAQQDSQTYHDVAVRNFDAQNAAKGFEAQASNQASLANAQLGTDVSKQNAQQSNEAAARTADAANQADLAKQDVETRIGLANIDASTRLQLAQMDQVTRVQLSQMENKYRQLIQTNQSASTMYNQAVAAIGNISMSDLSPIAKDSAIKTQINMLNEAMRTISAIGSKDASALASLNLSSFFLPEGLQDPNTTKNAVQEQRFSLEQAVRNAQSEIPVWGENYGMYQAPPGPNQSERTAANFNALYAQKVQEYQKRLQELDAFNRQNQ
jgi:hypothetical protein